MPPEEGTLRDRLIALVQAQADSIAEAPISITAMSWLALGDDMEQQPRGTGGSAEVRTLRDRVAEHYAAPFEAIFDSPEAVAELGEVDRTQAAALLFGPIVLGKLTTFSEFDHTTCVRAAVDGFLATHRRPAPDVQRSE